MGKAILKMDKNIMDFNIHPMIYITILGLCFSNPLLRSFN